MDVLDGHFLELCEDRVAPGIEVRDLDEVVVNVRQSSVRDGRGVDVRLANDPVDRLAVAHSLVVREVLLEGTAVDGYVL